MDESNGPSIDQLVRRFRQRELPRSRFMALLAGLGFSATGIATLTAAAESHTAHLPPRRKVVHRTEEHRNKKLHHEHVQRQARATHGQPVGAGAPAAAQAESRERQLQAILDDYVEHAVVEDPLFEQPIVGKAAIAQRKRAEMASMAGVTLDVTHRFAHGDEVVAEWVLRGTHRGDFMGFPATGRTIELRGVTVVTREHGKIVKEALHYDLADLYRQLT